MDQKKKYLLKLLLVAMYLIVTMFYTMNFIFGFIDWDFLNHKYVAILLNTGWWLIVEITGKNSFQKPRTSILLLMLLFITIN